jgi:hypothetical protein
MGGNLGWLSEMAILPETGDALVVMTNSSVGHEFFAAVLSEWTDWLGLKGTLQVAETIQRAGVILRLGALAVGAAGLGLLAWLARQVRAGRRQLGRRKPAWRSALAVGAPGLALLLYFWLAQPFLQASLPGGAGWMAAAFCLLCAAGIAWGLTCTRDRMDSSAAARCNRPGASG